MDSSEQQTKNEPKNVDDKDETGGFDFSAIMNSLKRLEESTELFSKTNNATLREANGKQDDSQNDSQDDKQEYKQNDKQDDKQNDTQNDNTAINNHDDSTDDVNVPLEELPIETKDNLPAVILENKQFDADEELVFEQRCKLYRFDTSDSEEGSQWKERGIGNLTIVRRSIGTNFTYRILMRRDKVYKLCANHFIRGDMKLKAHGKNNNSFLWSTSADLSETEPTFETLAARFKTVEDAERFKKAFGEAVEAMNKESDQAEENEEKQDNRCDSDNEEDNESTYLAVQNGTTKAD